MRTQTKVDGREVVAILTKLGERHDCRWTGVYHSSSQEFFLGEHNKKKDLLSETSSEMCIQPSVKTPGRVVQQCSWTHFQKNLPRSLDEVSNFVTFTSSTLTLVSVSRNGPEKNGN